MVELVFRIGASSDQQARVEAIRKVAFGFSPKALVQEDWAFEVVYVTVTNIPEPLHPAGDREESRAHL